MIAEVRGAGLMRGLQLNVDAAPVVEGALARGLLVNRTAETVVRLLPPLHGVHGGHRRGGGDARRRAGRSASGGEDEVNVDLVTATGQAPAPFHPVMVAEPVTFEMRLGARPRTPGKSTPSSRRTWKRAICCRAASTS